MLDGNAEVLVDGCHQLARPLVEGGVDLVGPLGPGVGDEQVAGHREDRDLPLGGVEMEDHDDVAVDPVDPLRAQAVGGVLHRERAAVGRPDQEDVGRAGVGPGRRDVDQALDAEPVDLAVEVPGVGGRPADDHHHQDAHTGERPPELPMAGAPASAVAAAPTAGPGDLVTEGAQTGLVEGGGAAGSARRAHRGPGRVDSWTLWTAGSHSRAGYRSWTPFWWQSSIVPVQTGCRSVSGVTTSKSAGRIRRVSHQ